MSKNSNIDLDTELESDALDLFHQGEKYFQRRADVGSELASMAKRAITNFLPEQHQAFFSMLSMVFVAAEDTENYIWASVLFGDSGFIQFNDKQSLIINSQFIDIDPLANQLQIGSEIGLLGIQFETRRRNRVSATISDITQSSITLEVKQCYGNCPKYIQRREGQKSKPDNAPVSIRFDQFDKDIQQFIHSSDSLFIASLYVEEKSISSNNNNRGIDSSHRGGVPGFIKITDGKTMLIPDYIGNNFFNTMGNISQNPKVGIQFLDYDNGHRVMLTGTAEVIWSEDQDIPFDGVDRMIKFTLNHGFHLKNSLPFSWNFKGYSPFSQAYSKEGIEL